MTEEKWLESSYPMGMIRALGTAASERKLNLLASGSFRRIWHLLPGPKSRHAVEVLERFAEGEATLEAITSARQLAWEDADLVDNPEGNKHPSEVAISAVSMEGIRDQLMTAADATAWVNVGTPEAVSEPEEREQCRLIRDIFGNPFRPVAVNPNWLTSTVVTLAEGIYQDRAFDRMPILADALQDAGCDNSDVLNHCRQPGEHVRGCWVVDLLTGRK